MTFRWIQTRFVAPLSALLLPTSITQTQLCWYPHCSTPPHILPLQRALYLKFLAFLDFATFLCCHCFFLHFYRILLHYLHSLSHQLHWVIGEAGWSCDGSQVQHYPMNSGVMHHVLQKLYLSSFSKGPVSHVWKSQWLSRHALLASPRDLEVINSCFPR